MRFLRLCRESLLIQRKYFNTSWIYRDWRMHFSSIPLDYIHIILYCQCEHFKKFFADLLYICHFLCTIYIDRYRKDVVFMEDKISDIINDDNILVLTVEQTSKILQLGKSTTYEIVNNPNCPFIVHHLGKSIRVEKKSLLESLRTPITV